MNHGSVISFASGKGGVGKTSLVANLGRLYAANGSNTLLIDGDWSLGKLSITLGARPQWTVEEVLREKVTMAEALHTVGDHLSVLASPSGVLGFEELTEIERNHIFFEVEKLCEQFDVVLFDHSSGIHAGVMQFAAASHRQVIVTTPEPTSYTDAYAIMKILSKRYGVREFDLLVTMSQNSEESEQIISRFSEVVRQNLNVRMQLLDILPWEPNIALSIRRRQLFVEAFPENTFTRRLEAVRQKLQGKRVLSTPSGLSFRYDVQVG